MHKSLILLVIYTVSLLGFVGGLAKAVGPALTAGFSSGLTKRADRFFSGEEAAYIQPHQSALQADAQRYNTQHTSQVTSQGQQFAADMQYNQLMWQMRENREQRAHQLMLQNNQFAHDAEMMNGQRGIFHPQTMGEAFRWPERYQNAIQDLRLPGDREPRPMLPGGGTSIWSYK